MPATAPATTTWGTVATWTVRTWTGSCVHGFTVRVFTVEVWLCVVIEVATAFKGDGFFPIGPCVAFGPRVMVIAFAMTAIAAFWRAFAVAAAGWRHLGALLSK